MVTRCGGLSSLGWTGRPHAPPRKESRDLPPQPRAHRQLAPALRRPPRHVNNTQGDTPTHLQHQGAAGISSLAHSAHKTQYTHNTHTDTHMHTHLQHQGARIESIQMLKWDVRASSLNPPNSWLGCGKGGGLCTGVCAWQAAHPLKPLNSGLGCSARGKGGAGILPCTADRTELANSHTAPGLTQRRLHNMRAAIHKPRGIADKQEPALCRFTRRSDRHSAVTHTTFIYTHMTYTPVQSAAAWLLRRASAARKLPRRRCWTAG